MLLTLTSSYTQEHGIHMVIHVCCFSECVPKAEMASHISKNNLWADACWPRNFVGGYLHFKIFANRPADDVRSHTTELGQKYQHIYTNIGWCIFSCNWWPIFAKQINQFLTKESMTIFLSVFVISVWIDGNTIIFL